MLAFKDKLNVSSSFSFFAFFRSFAMDREASGEIITLQLGNYANHVGAHFWNAQEALFTFDPDAPVRSREHALELLNGLM
jgi:hypothetical protein